MHPLRILFALALIASGMAVCRADELYSGISNTSCTVTLIENDCYRIRYLGGLHPALEIGTKSFSKYIDLKQDESFWKGDYKITLFNDNITEAEAKTIFDSALDTLRHFQFDKPGLGMMDGNGVTLTVSSDSGNSMQVSISPLEDFKYASPGIARIIKIADAHASKEWVWDKKLPAQLATGMPRRNRKATAAVLSSLFPKGQTLPTVKYLLAVLGRPDGFSKQFGLSRTKGSAETGNGGGTLLFLQDDGSEIHAWTPDFKRIVFAGRYGPKPDEEAMLYWAPRR
jgi:hypothetical protein